MKIGVMTIDEAIQEFVQMKNDGVKDVFVYYRRDKIILDEIAEIDKDKGWGATPEDVKKEVVESNLSELDCYSDYWEVPSVEDTLTEERENASLPT